MSIIAVDRTTAHSTNATRNMGVTYAREGICEGEYDCEIAVRAAAATFDPRRSGQRKIDVECTGGAVDFAGYDANQLRWQDGGERP
jgi:hypothetical protein